MMIVSIPRQRPREKGSEDKRRTANVNAILRAAYRRHSRSRLTVEAVRRCLG